MQNWPDIVSRMMSKGARISSTEGPALAQLLSASDGTDDTAMILGCTEDSTEPKSKASSSAIWQGMLLMHPLLMGVTFLISLWVAWQGINRARFSHLRQKAAFNWNGHVKYGLIVMGLWLVGMLAGSVMTDLAHDTFGFTDLHGTIALSMLPLMAFGGISGLYMDRKKHPRRLLPILHGVVNMALIALAIAQATTGLWLVKRIF